MDILFLSSVVKKSRKRRSAVSLFFLLLGLMLLAGCLSSRPSKFYILTPVGPDTPKTPDCTPMDGTGTAEEGDKKSIFGKLTLGMGPVTIAKYLNRSQLVVRLGPNEIQLEEFHQWAAAPRDEIPAVVVENLNQILGMESIYKYPWKSYVNPDYQITVDILQLDGRLGEGVHLSVRWEILQGNTRNRVGAGKANFTEPVSGEGFDQYVAAQSRALGRLSCLIARSLVESIGS